MNYKDIALIALDLDDTTLRTGSALSDVTRDAICALAELGVEIVIASGRGFSALPQPLLSLGVVRYAITSNGAAINRADGSRITACKLSASAVQAVLRLIPEGQMFEAFLDGVPYSYRCYVDDPVKYGCSPSNVAYVQATRRPLDDVRGFCLAHIDELDCINVVCNSIAERTELGNAVAAAADDVYITNAGRHLLEIADEHAGKGTALRELCKMLGVEASQVAAFGNADNDADMVAFAGLGVAVANATESCLACADRITLSNDEDGVALVLQEILRAKTQ